MLRSFRSSSANNKTSEYPLCLREQGRAHAQFNTQRHLSQKNGNGGIAGVCHIEPHENGQDPNPKCSQAVLENAACRGASAVPAMQESRRGWRASWWERGRMRGGGGAGRVPAVLWKRQQRMEEKTGGVNYHSSDNTLRQHAVIKHGNALVRPAPRRRF